MFSHHYHDHYDPVSVASHWTVANYNPSHWSIANYNPNPMLTRIAALEVKLAILIMKSSNCAIKLQFWSHLDVLSSMDVQNQFPYDCRLVPLVLIKLKVADSYPPFFPVNRLPVQYWRDASRALERKLRSGPLYKEPQPRRWWLHQD